MKTIIAGSRNITRKTEVEFAIKNCVWTITEIISGGAKGVDWLGHVWGVENGIAVKVYHAQWNTYGKSAGMVRNAEMAEIAEALIAVWDGRSRGTQNMIEIAEKKGLKVAVHLVLECKWCGEYHNGGPEFCAR